MPTLESRLRGGLWGLVVGDALGVPVQFMPRARVRENPVTDLRPGPGGRPPGTWSDDSSMALALADSLTRAGWDPDDQMRRFARWLVHGEYTPHGEAWDIGGTTMSAVLRCHAGEPAGSTGDRLESQNGNGALMRCLPASIWLAAGPAERAIERAMAHSALTHAHVRSKLCVAYHAIIVRGLLAGTGVRTAMKAATILLETDVPDDERPVLSPILSRSILDRRAAEIGSTGYVVDTLGAALWSVARHDTWSGAVLEAVNLGHDADTTGAVAGGLAGLVHGVEAIPAGWLARIQRADAVGEWIDAFVAAARPRLAPRPGTGPILPPGR